MTRSSEAIARDAKIAELKRLISSGTFDTLEMLEEAVDAFLWSEQDQLHAAQAGGAGSAEIAPRDMARSFPR